jgi:hypothetical protein
MTLPPHVPPPAAAPSASSQAITALILGILGVLCCGLLAPIAWYIGNQELQAIREMRSPAAGEGLATAGKILGIIGTALLGVAILWIVLFGGFAVLSGMMSGISH